MTKPREEYAFIKIKEKIYPFDIGDMVLFSGHSGTLVNLEDEGMLIILNANYITCRLEPPATQIDGLFFQGIDGDYFQATYEQAAELIARGIKRSKWHQHFVVKDFGKPSLEEYDEQEQYEVVK